MNLLGRSELALHCGHNIAHKDSMTQNGRVFFYPGFNGLASRHASHRHPWFFVPCVPCQLCFALVHLGRDRNSFGDIQDRLQRLKFGGLTEARLNHGHRLVVRTAEIAKKRKSSIEGSVYFVHFIA